MTCSDCGAPITAHSQTGRCRPCAVRRNGWANAGRSRPDILRQKHPNWKGGAPHCSTCGVGITRRSKTGRCLPCVLASRRGANSPNWKGDGLASDKAGRQRARKLYPIAEDQECDRCTAEATERHHIDGNPLNNERSNIEYLCTPCHGRTRAARVRRAEATLTRNLAG